MVVQPTADFEVGSSIPGKPTVGAGAAVGELVFEPPTYTFAVGCFTTRPLRILQ